MRETNYDIVAFNEAILKGETSMTNEQRNIYGQILDSIELNLLIVFFLDAPGGSFKTLLIYLLLVKVRSSHKIPVATTSSRITATLLFGGKTAQSAIIG